MSQGVQKVSLAEKFAAFEERWSPKVVAEFGEMQVKVVKLQGEFVWHRHDNEDELFLVAAGRLTIRLREGDITLGPGELAVIPRGVEHMPVAEEEVHLVLIEPGTTLNTGNVRNERTVEVPQRL